MSNQSYKTDLFVFLDRLATAIIVAGSLLIFGYGAWHIAMSAMEHGHEKQMAEIQAFGRELPR